MVGWSGGSASVVGREALVLLALVTAAGAFIAVAWRRAHSSGTAETVSGALSSIAPRRDPDDPTGLERAVMAEIAKYDPMKLANTHEPGRPGVWGFLFINYDEYDQTSYRAVVLKSSMKDWSSTTYRFASGDPVADMDSALAQAKALGIGWVGGSSVDDFIGDGIYYDRDEATHRYYRLDTAGIDARVRQRQRLINEMESDGEREDAAVLRADLDHLLSKRSEFENPLRGSGQS